MFLRIVFIGKIWTIGHSANREYSFLRIVFIGKIWTCCYFKNTFDRFLRIVFIGKIWTAVMVLWLFILFLRIVFIGKIWTPPVYVAPPICSWGLYLLVRFELIMILTILTLVLEDCIYWWIFHSSRATLSGFESHPFRRESHFFIPVTEPPSYYKIILWIHIHNVLWLEVLFLCMTIRQFLNFICKRQINTV